MAAAAVKGRIDLDLLVVLDGMMRERKIPATTFRRMPTRRLGSEVGTLVVVWAVSRELRPDCGIWIGQTKRPRVFCGATKVALCFSVLAAAEVAMAEARAQLAACGPS
jgi:hypothetical protein